MHNHPADDFISALTSTVKDYKSKIGASRELEHLVDMSAHMIAALGAVRSRQRSTSGSANPGTSH